MTEANQESFEDLYLSGKKLYGDDFTECEIREWFEDESEGYYNLSQSATNGTYTYGYHSLNKLHGFSRLPRRTFAHVLGIGSAFGDELLPILSKVEKVSILEPSEGFEKTELNGIPVDYMKPQPSGQIPSADKAFDLVTCIGVLHHIPNVGKVINEIFRVLTPGGCALIREPVTSMGDWRKPRVGLTKRERGIPAPILRELIAESGFLIISERKCMFSLTSRLRFLTPGAVYNNPLFVAFDAVLSGLPVWPKQYHARNVLHKLRPTSVYYVLQKPGDRS